MTIEEILNSGLTADEKIAALSEKTLNVPVWSGRYGIEQEYNPRKHPVANTGKYPDIITDEETLELLKKYEEH